VDGNLLLIIPFPVWLALSFFPLLLLLLFITLFIVITLGFSIGCGVLAWYWTMGNEDSNKTSSFFFFSFISWNESSRLISSFDISSRDDGDEERNKSWSFTIELFKLS